MEARGVEGQEKITELGGQAEICRKLKTDPASGLSGDDGDISSRRQAFGSNVIPPKKAVPFWKLCWEAAEDTTLIILMISALVSLILFFVVKYALPEEGGGEEGGEEWIDAVAILGTVVVVVLVTAGNDYAKEKQFRRLQNKIESDHYFAVCRKGEVIEIPVADIVVGDICQVKNSPIFSHKIQQSSYFPAKIRRLDPSGWDPSQFQRPQSGRKFPHWGK